MKAVVFIIWLVSLINPENVEVEKITLKSQIEIDGEIHKQNMIDSVEGFLDELELDADTCYIPFRDVNNHDFPIHQVDVENFFQRSFHRSPQQ